MSDERLLVWDRVDEPGLEWCLLTLGPERQVAHGVSLCTGGVPFRCDYRLDTGPDFTTRSLHVRTAGPGWSRTLNLHRTSAGTWTCDTSFRGDIDLPSPGGDPFELTGAVDCDLGLSPLTNTLPVRRLGLLDPGRPAGPVELVMAWVAVPSLELQPSRQSYTQLDPSTVRFASDDFTADLTLDAEGLVVDYPGLARRRL